MKIDNTSIKKLTPWDNPRSALSDHKDTMTSSVNSLHKDGKQVQSANDEEPSLFPSDKYPPEKQYTVSEVARVLGVSPQHVYRLIAQEELRAVRFKIRQKRVLKSELNRYLAILNKNG